MRYTGPIVRKSRRYGAILFGNGKSKENAFKKRKYPPGLHGRSSFRSMSEFGKQLHEKQKARFMFGITEKQFRKYYKKALRLEGATGPELLRLLEKRLDNVIFRAGFADSRRQARQMASHGHFEINGKRVDIPSIEVNPGDKITLRAKSQKSPLFEKIRQIKKPVNPKWMNVDYGNVEIKIGSLPEEDDLEQLIESQLIVEFYSK